MPKTLPAAPATRPKPRHLDRPLTVLSLQSAAVKAAPGDVVQLEVGRYHDPVVVSGGGEPGRPVTFRGHRGGGVVLDGGKDRAAGLLPYFEPMDDDFAFLKLLNAAHVVFEDLDFRNCWPSAVFMRAVQDVTFRRCRFFEGRFAVFARSGPLRSTRNITLEDCTWVQDPRRDMWEGRITWLQVKRQEKDDASFFNGALFGAYGIEGGVTLRRCRAEHAFNVLRMDADGRRSSTPVNRGVRVEDCRFAFIRDNVIEPEGEATDWRVTGNVMFNCHAAFSFDGVEVRDTLYAGNAILNWSAPGPIPRPGDETEHYRGGKIWKLPKPGKAPERVGLISAFNSVQTRTSIAKKGAFPGWVMANCALGLWSSDHPDPPNGRREAFPDMDWTGIETAGVVCDDPNPDDPPGFRIVDRVFERPTVVPEAEAWPWPWPEARLALTQAAAVLPSEAVDVPLPSGATFTAEAGHRVGVEGAWSTGLIDAIRNDPGEADPPAGIA